MQSTAPAAHTHTHPLACCSALALLPGLGFVSGSHDTSVKVWSASGDLLATCAGHTALVYSVAGCGGDTPLIASGEWCGWGVRVCLQGGWGQGMV
jgi:WD40 repeat protein